MVPDSRCDVLCFPSMSYETVRYAVAESGVATIALDHPETRNALSDQVLDDLLAAFIAARDDDAVRCVVLTSTHEKVFSAGGDLAGFAADVPLVLKHFATERFPRLFQLIGALGNARRPTSCCCSASASTPRRRCGSGSSTRSSPRRSSTRPSRSGPTSSQASPP
jgi:hypothetical protein